MCFKYPFSFYRCNHCFECLQERRRDWSLRLQWEAYNVQKPFIFHLTYSNENLRYSKGLPTLCKRDIDLFFKRLRHVFPQNKIYYFLCGEYSPSCNRPHYHCAVFGIPQNLSRNEVKKKIEETWRLGYCLFRSQWLKSPAQLHYITKYMLNSFYWRDDDPREKPFNFISKNIGLSYVDYAIKHNIYKKEIQDHFICVHKDVVKSNSKGEIEIKSKPIYPMFDYIFHYDINNGEIIFNSILENFPDYFEIYEIDKNGKGVTRRYPLPTYWRNKLISEDMRYCLFQMKQMKSRLKTNKYLDEYGSYDYDLKLESLRQDVEYVPMWKQIKRSKFDKYKQTVKDKSLKNKDIYIL